MKAPRPGFVLLVHDKRHRLSQGHLTQIPHHEGRLIVVSLSGLIVCIPARRWDVRLELGCWIRKYRVPAVVRSLDGLGSFPLGEYSEVNYWETRSRHNLVIVNYWYSQDWDGCHERPSIEDGQLRDSGYSAMIRGNIDQLNSEISRWYLYMCIYIYYNLQIDQLSN